LGLTAPLLLAHLGASAALPAFYILLGANLAPALFGATGVIMAMSGLEQTRARLTAAILPVAALSLLWTSAFGTTGFAISIALAHLGLAAISAHVLARRYLIWPTLLWHKA